ncbi:hypothetical protein MMC34_005350 [Xylographa carneopallida]|nr:hypothetical protein [Xylographa carneopallida]
MSQVSSYIATPLLIVSVCILRYVLTAGQTLLCLKDHFPSDLNHLEEDDIECIWNIAKDDYPFFFNNMCDRDLDGSRDDASAYMQNLEKMTELEPSEEALKRTFWTIVTMARSGARTVDS